MRVFFVLLLLACCNVHAELPPVIDNSAYPPSVNPARAAVSPTTTASYELLGRIDQLQAEIQQLTGKVEEQANLIAELKKRQTTLYSDFDERLRNIETKTAGTAQSAPDASQVVPTPVEEPVAIKPDIPVTEPATAEKPVVEDKPITQENPVAEEKPVVSDKSAQEDKSEIKQPPKPEVVVASGDEKKDFQQAYTSFRTGHTEQSIAQFNTYLTQYPQGGFAGNAQYWLGEAYRVKQDNNAARKAFNDVIEKYPGSAKLPDAILKLGVIEIDQKDSTKAREYLNRVIKEYPNTQAALSAGKKLHQLDEIKN